MLPGKVRRTQDHAARHAVELDQRERRGELIAGEEHDAAAAQLLEPAAKARGVAEFS